MNLNSSSFSGDHLVYRCSTSKTRLSIALAMGAVKITFIFPLCTFILYLGHQRWRQRHSFNSVSHSDLFTFNLAAMEMFWVIGFLCYACGNYSQSLALITVGISSCTITYYGEMFFSMLTCIERYLAVVHPVTYLGLRNTRGIRIRNKATACVWLLSLAIMTVYSVLPYDYLVVAVVPLLIVCIAVISFCSVCVACILVRPGPGEGSGDRGQGSQSKQRALHTIVTISGVVWLWFVGSLVSIALNKLPLLDESIVCLVTINVSWFNLPTSMASPLLYLHKTGKLSRCY